MVCDYLGEASGPVCRARADKGIIIPTIMEETRYCLTERFRDCQHWQNWVGVVNDRKARRGNGEAQSGGSARAVER